MPPGQDTLEIGAALGIVIGRRATRIDAARAADYIAGYTVVSDVSVPHASYYRPAVRHKCRDGYCPIGPWVTAREQAGNPDALTMVSAHQRRGTPAQSHQADLLRPVAQLLADVTAFMSLEAGDVLLAGVPEGAPLARAGDTVEIGDRRRRVPAAPGRGSHVQETA
ncbi:fumarylacetoacetate hydrolase family protein [Cupriavidus basilensis]